METTASTITDRRIWVRVLYMVFFWVAFSVSEVLLAIVAIFQAVCALFTGTTNDAMHRFGKNLSAYVAQILEFLTFNSEELAFPFSDWPDATPTETPWTPDEGPVAAEAPVDKPEPKVEAIKVAAKLNASAPMTKAPGPQELREITVAAAPFKTERYQAKGAGSQVAKNRASAEMTKPNFN